MSKIRTIAFLYPGAMGTALASLLHTRAPSLHLVTSVGGRSQTTRDRAAVAGLVDMSLPSIVLTADVIISILPPSAAVPVATEVGQLLHSLPPGSARAAPLIYVDANAVSPETISAIAEKLGPEVPLIDGSIIGLPPSTGEEGNTKEPVVYLAAQEKWGAELQSVAEALREGWSKVKILPDAGAGAASALKMCYGGLAKGTIGLASLLILAANAHSPATAKALLEEMADSRPDNLAHLSFALQDMQPKAYRWIGEMEEISSFVASSLGDGMGRAHEGLAAVFERVAADLRATGSAIGGAADGPVGDAKEIHALDSFAKDAKKVLETKGYKKR